LSKWFSRCPEACGIEQPETCIMTGIEAFLEVLARAGVKYIFGNPGTTELPLMDALIDDDRFRYILGLHEVPVMAMADGYAQASRQPGVVNVHVSCGLGNAMGMLYNAHIAGSPLLLTAGQQDRRLRLEEPVLVGDLVSVARPWTKWAVEVQRVEDMPTVVRRAVQIALTPPTGPVFLSLPLDVQSEESDRLQLEPLTVPDSDMRPSREGLGRAVAVLREARSPGILAGCRVTEAGAVAELVAVAERLGAPVWSESATTHGRVPFPVDHPLNCGALPLWSPDARRSLERFDVLLVAGFNLPRQYLYHEPMRMVPEHIRLVQMDVDAGQIGRIYAVEAGVVAGLKAGLGELDRALAEGQTPAEQVAAKRRTEEQTALQAQARRELRAEVAAQSGRRPLTPLTFMDAVARVFPPDGAVVEEAATTTNRLLERLGALKDPTAYIGHRGWALGWGLGCSLGVKLAWPQRPVLALLGEGSTLYGIQGLWTAAHYRIPVTFVVCNNAEYQILKDCARLMPLPRMAAGRFLAMDLVQPEIDFVSLAKSLGVEARRVTEPEELSERLRASLAGDKPVLLDVPMARHGVSA
jgi:benzoylformate decarboxylase